MDGNTLALIVSAITGLAALGGSLFVARRYQTLGGGVAQEKLNAVLKDLSASLEDQLASVSTDLNKYKRQFAECKTSLTALRSEIQADRTRLIALEAAEQIRAIAREEALVLLAAAKTAAIELKEKA